MYYPTQIPYILNQAFAKNMSYTEESAAACGGFVICFWNMQPTSGGRLSVTNVIAADACIDLVAAYDEQLVGFSGLRKTEFDYRLDLPARFFGARLMPGAFHQLTRLPASAAMDAFLPVEAVYDDFDRALFFSLPFERAKEYFKDFLKSRTQGKIPDTFTSLFNTLSHDAPSTARELCRTLHFSPRQCQRLFQKHYGISPKMALSIIRFQKCLEILTSPEAKSSDIPPAAGYFDQPHFIKDFKQNIGITPLELIRTYQD